MKTDYASHDRAYQRKRNDPARIGWIKQDELDDDWRLSWQPLLRKNAFPKQGRLLELGCGAGNTSLQFVKQAYEVVGVDIAPTAIDWAIENAARTGINATFLTGNVLTLAEDA